MKCPKCNKIYDDDFKYCPYCGNRTPQIKICPQCRIESYEYSYCPKCGEKLLNKIELEDYIIRDQTVKEQEKVRESARRSNLEKRILIEYAYDKYGLIAGLIKMQIESGWLKTMEEVDSEAKWLMEQNKPQKVDSKGTVFMDENYSKRKRNFSSDSDYKEDHNYWKEFYG